MTQGMEGRRAGKFMVSSPSSHQASVLENDIVYGAFKGEHGQAWERIMAKYVLTANLLGREHEGSRSSMNILIKITVYVQK